MLNPKDIDLMDTPEGREKLPPEFLAEMRNNKGDDEDEKEEN